MVIASALSLENRQQQTCRWWCS